MQSTREDWRTTVTSQSIRSESRRSEHDAIRPATHHNQRGEHILRSLAAHERVATYGAAERFSCRLKKGFP